MFVCRCFMVFRCVSWGVDTDIASFSHYYRIILTNKFTYKRFFFPMTEKWERDSKTVHNRYEIKSNQYTRWWSLSRKRTVQIVHRRSMKKKSNRQNTHFSCPWQDAEHWKEREKKMENSVLFFLLSFSTNRPFLSPHFATWIFYAALDRFVFFFLLLLSYSLSTSYHCHLKCNEFMWYSSTVTKFHVHR